MAQEQELKPRSEARPLGKDELTEAQKEAGAQATRLLTAMAAPAPHLRERESSKRHPYFPLIDEERQNRVVLLDGKRGSGKSALLITLLDLYQDRLDEKPLSLPEGWAPLEARCIVPAGLIDLEPLPESTNLLLHLLGHLERVVEALEGGEEEGKCRLPMAPWQGEDRSETASRRAWRELARTVTVGWDKGLDPRKGRLDPEAYVLEAEYNELTRMGLPKALRKFLDALAEDYKKSQRLPQLPLFLLAIDDADMNPGRSAELLDLLRKLYHPRLAFLLAGDSELFEQSLRLSLARREGFDAENVHKMPRVLQSLPREIYNKVIPQHQRCKLKGLSPERRLDFPTEDPVRKKLERLVMPDGSKLLDFQPYPRSQGTGTDGLIATLLPETLRGLISFNEQLAAPPEGEPPTSSTALALTARAIATLWGFVVDSEPEYWELKDLVRLVEKRDDTSLLVDSSKFVYEIEYDYSKEIELKRFSFSFRAPTDFVLKKIVPAQRADVRPEYSDMPSNVSLAFVLASEFAQGFAKRTNTRFPPLPMMSSEDDVFAKTRWRRTIAPPAPEDPGMNVTMHNIRKSVISIHNRKDSPPSMVLQIHWPFPRWNSLNELMYFIAHWRNELSNLKVSVYHSENELAPDSMAWGVLRAVLNTFKTDGSKNLEKFSWAQLEKELRWLNNKDYTKAGSEWLVRKMGLLAAPESGLSARFAEALLDCLRHISASTWPDVAMQLREERRTRLRAALANVPQQLSMTSPLPSVTELIQELDDSAQENPFAHRVEFERSSRSPRQIHFEQKLFQEASSYPMYVRLPPGNTGSENSLSLGGYFTPIRTSFMDGVSALDLENLWKAVLEHRVEDDRSRVLLDWWKILTEQVGSAELASQLRMNKDNRGLEFGENLSTVMEEFSRKARAVDERKWEKYNENGMIIYISSSIQSNLSLYDSMTTPAEAIARIAYDFDRDAKDVEPYGQETSIGRRAVAPRWWHLVRVGWKERSFFFNLPTIAWATLWEWEILENFWQHIVFHDTAGRFQVAPSEAMDEVAIWLLRMSLACVSRNPHLASVQDLREFAVIFDRCAELHEQYGPLNNYRRFAFEEWLRRLCVLGAPESALSEDTARKLLAAWKDSKLGQSETFKDIRPESYRVQRLRDSGYSEQQARQLLDEVNQEFPGHPWYEFVNSHGS